VSGRERHRAERVHDDAVAAFDRRSQLLAPDVA
jgi:hypothetical protein